MNIPRRPLSMSLLDVLDFLHQGGDPNIMLLQQDGSNIPLIWSMMIHHASKEKKSSLSDDDPNLWSRVLDTWVDKGGHWLPPACHATLQNTITQHLQQNIWSVSCFGPISPNDLRREEVSLLDIIKAAYAANAPEADIALSWGMMMTNKSLALFIHQIQPFCDTVDPHLFVSSLRDVLRLNIRLRPASDHWPIVARYLCQHLGPAQAQNYLLGLSSGTAIPHEIICTRNHVSLQLFEEMGWEVRHEHVKDLVSLFYRTTATKIMDDTLFLSRALDKWLTNGAPAQVPMFHASRQPSSPGQGMLEYDAYQLLALIIKRIGSKNLPVSLQERMATTLLKHPPILDAQPCAMGTLGVLELPVLRTVARSEWPAFAALEDQQLLQETVTSSNTTSKLPRKM